MSRGTVLLLTDDPGVLPVWEGWERLRIRPADGPASTFPARVCAAINAAAPTGPLIAVARGEWATLLPAVSMSQRSNRRSIAEYVLVDPVIPPVTDAWPDAPVSLFATEANAAAARLGALRGWRVRPLAELEAWSPAD